MAKQKKLIWAMDPFTKSSRKIGVAANNLSVIAKATGAEIEPVYVLSPDGFGFAGDFSSNWLKEFMPKAKTKMKKVLEKLDVDTLPAKILTNRSLSMSGDSRKLINYAKRHGALGIFVTTHARSGLGKFVVGSFAETTILQAKAPMIVSNPDSKPIRKLKTIVFATDATTDSRKAFLKLVDFAKNFRGKIVLYHKLPDPIEPVVQTGVHLAGGGWISVQQFLKKEQAEKKEKLQSWAERAKSMGVSCTVVVDDSPGFVTDSLLDQAKRSNADMVSLLSKSGPLTSLFIGSIGRQLARQSTLPVYIMHKDEK